MRDGEGEGDGAYQDAQDDEEGGYGTDFKSEEFVANHFDTDEAEKNAETVFEEPEHVGYVAEKEEEGTETHDGKDVGEVDDEGVGGDGENSGDAVDGEDNVGEFDDEEDEEEGCHEAAAVFLDKEVVAFDMAAEGEEAAGEFDDGVVGGIDFVVAFVAEHFDTTVNEYDTKDGQDP